GEEIGGVGRVLEDETRRLVDRHLPGAGRRIRPAPGADGPGPETPVSIAAHAWRLVGRRGRSTGPAHPLRSGLGTQGVSAPMLSRPDPGTARAVSANPFLRPIRSGSGSSIRWRSISYP